MDSTWSVIRSRLLSSDRFSQFKDRSTSNVGSVPLSRQMMCHMSIVSDPGVTSLRIRSVPVLIRPFRRISFTKGSTLNCLPCLQSVSTLLIKTSYLLVHQLYLRLCTLVFFFFQVTTLLCHTLILL